MTPEGKVKAKVCAWLKENGVWYFMPVQMGMGRAGIPDIIACIKGHFVAIECKAGKGTTTALQDRELGSIRTSGGLAFVVSDDEDSFQTMSNTVQLLILRTAT